jgi:GxxExxY protein
MLCEDITGKVLAAALEVHSELGPGLLESVYARCLARELRSAGVPIDVEVDVPVSYKGALLDLGFRLDILVADAVVVEVKAVQRVVPVHKAQLLTYLKLTQRRVGLLLNFNTVHLRDGITRVVL